MPKTNSISNGGILTIQTTLIWNKFGVMIMN